MSNLTFPIGRFSLTHYDQSFISEKPIASAIYLSLSYIISDKDSPSLNSHYIPTEISNQQFWPELFAERKILSFTVSPLESSPLQSLDFSFDYLFKTKNRSSPIRASIFSCRTSSHDVILAVLIFVGEYHIPVSFGILSSSNFLVYENTSFPPLDLERLFGNSSYRNHRLKNILQFVSYRTLRELTIPPQKIIILGLTESIGHYIQEEMAFVSNLLSILNSGLYPKIKIITVNSFALPANLFESLKSFSPDLVQPVLPRRFDAYALTFCSPLWSIHPSSSWISPCDGSTANPCDLLGGYMSNVDLYTSLRSPLKCLSAETCELSLVIGTRFHSRGYFDLRLDQFQFINLAESIVNLIRSNNDFSCSKLRLIVDFSSYDPDYFASNSSLFDLECVFWRNLSTAFNSHSFDFDVKLITTLGFSLFQKIDLFANASMGLYPFGSGMCAMAHLTTTPLVEYRPSYHHSESILTAERVKTRPNSTRSNCYNINYDNILFADEHHCIHSFSDSEYWFIPGNVAQLFVEVVTCQYQGLIHPYWANDT